MRAPLIVWSATCARIRHEKNDKKKRNEKRARETHSPNVNGKRTASLRMVAAFLLALRLCEIRVHSAHFNYKLIVVIAVEVLSFFENYILSVVPFDVFRSSVVLSLRIGVVVAVHRVIVGSDGGVRFFFCCIVVRSCFFACSRSSPSLSLAPKNVYWNCSSIQSYMPLLYVIREN